MRTTEANVQHELIPLAVDGHRGAMGAAERVERRSPAALSSASVRHMIVGECTVLVAADLTVLGPTAYVVERTLFGGAIWAAAVVFAFGAAGLYRPRLRLSALDDTPRLLLAVGMVLVVGAWLSPVLPAVREGAATSAVWLAGVAGVATVRALAYAALRRRRRTADRETVVVIGSGDVGIRITEALRDDGGYGLTPIGLVGPPPIRDLDLPAPLLGTVDELDRIIAVHRPHGVVVAFSPGSPDADLLGTLRRCRGLGMAVYVVPRLFELSVGRVDAELVQGIPLVRLRPEPQRRWQSMAKRVVDVAGAVLGLVLLSPVFAACALAVRLESGRGNVLFRQTRIGHHGRPFTMMKFRSLTPSSTLESQVCWNISQDDRIGPVGRVLRGTSLDELPQLLNVLRGDMSLVGPRPERPFFVDQFRRTYDGYADRHRVLGGITGWAQIHGLRGDTSIVDRVRFDNYYVENWSLALDLKIILGTVASMFSLQRR
jgi:exopolysaccharide biosynthesis polyprenyl glycosylphosphotransferase